jgi:SAM-dependent methyltransferase
MIPPHVVWHDVECGGYAADLPLWRALARRAGGRVLDVGAGTGRVARDLAAAGHEVVALDRDPELLAVLRQRAEGIETVVADAADFTVAGTFGLVAVPMQTIQLLPDRAGFFASARRAIAPGGIVALAIADDLEDFDGDADLPRPDVGEVGGLRYVSQPTAVRATADRVRIERLRRIAGEPAEPNVIVLARVSAEALHAEGAAAGLRGEPSIRVAATEEHVGSEVVVLRG